MVLVLSFSKAYQLGFGEDGMDNTYLRAIVHMVHIDAPLQFYHHRVSVIQISVLCADSVIMHQNGIQKNKLIYTKIKTQALQ